MLDYQQLDAFSKRAAQDAKDDLSTAEYCESRAAQLLKDAEYLRARSERRMKEAEQYKADADREFERVHGTKGIAA